MNALPTVNFLRRAKDTFRVVKDGLHTMIKTVKFCCTKTLMTGLWTFDLFF